MNPEKFNKLTPIQKQTILIAIIVRNEMDDFHAEHLSDKQMKELNPIIRQAIFDALNLLEILNDPNSNKNQFDEAISIANFEIGLIPDYWEIPEHVSEDFVEATQKTNERYRDQSWVKNSEVLELHNTLLELSDITLDSPQDSIKQYFTEKEMETIRAARNPWLAFSGVRSKKIIAIIAQLREHKVTQAQIMEARGSLSRSDIKSYYQASYKLDS